MPVAAPRRLIWGQAVHEKRVHQTSEFFELLHHLIARPLLPVGLIPTALRCSAKQHTLKAAWPLLPGTVLIARILALMFIS